MRRSKALSLAAVAAAAFMTWIGAGTASAGTTELFSGHNTLSAGSTIKGSLLAGSSTLLVSTDRKTVYNTCTESTFEGITNQATVVNGPIIVGLTSLTWGGCKFATNTLANGSLAITNTTGVATGGNGQLLGIGTVVTVNIGVTCRFGFGAGSNLGTLIGKTNTNEHAELEINAVVNEQEPKAFLCPDTTILEAFYTGTSPTGLNVGT